MLSVLRIRPPEQAFRSEPREIGTAEIKGGSDPCGAAAYDSVVMLHAKAFCSIMVAMLDLDTAPVTFNNFTVLKRIRVGMARIPYLPGSRGFHPHSV